MGSSEVKMMGIFEIPAPKYFIQKYIQIVLMAREGIEPALIGINGD